MIHKKTKCFQGNIIRIMNIKGKMQPWSKFWSSDRTKAFSGTALFLIIPTEIKSKFPRSPPRYGSADLYQNVKDPEHCKKETEQIPIPCPILHNCKAFRQDSNLSFPALPPGLVLTWKATASGTTSTPASVSGDGPRLVAKDGAGVAGSGGGTAASSGGGGPDGGGAPASPGESLRGGGSGRGEEGGGAANRGPARSAVLGPSDTRLRKSFHGLFFWYISSPFQNCMPHIEIV